MAYSIHTLPKLDQADTTFQEFSRRLKNLRLQSLKADPDKWVSIYDSEVNQPDDFWWNRLQDSQAIHHILVKNTSESDGPDSKSVLLAGEWVGFVVIIVPDAENKSPEYLMNALYIDTQARGIGLGKRMVRQVIDTVRKHETKAGQAPPFCTASVRHGNDSALALYRKLGFRVVNADGIAEKEGRKYRTIEIRYDI
ncbi:hypothetical protein LTR84_001930 [Exophiala bonariae]|uniref:N-acetyltransferase domain-containing protein n=1 Tax=Exophiala bonariae TaxID=1690606 RepID=A0AAV9NC06_9EURO|nr:hypothetical protein LTR84_001930 [Exophiala bonariae]